MYKSLNKTQLKVFVRQEIDNIGVCPSIKLNRSTEIYDMFLWLFERHSDYPNKFYGMTDIFIKHNEQYINQLEVHIKKEDGSTDDVSVMKNCITGIPKDNLYIAMRNSIIPQIIKFKYENEPVCSICKNTEKLEVDHTELDFIELYANFKKTQSYIPTSFDNNLLHSKIFKKEDIEFENKWNLYHQTNAKLQILCKLCNTSKPKKLLKKLNKL